MDKALDIGAAIVTLAIVAVIVGSKNTSKDVTALGSAFSGSIRAATGR